MFVRGGCPSPHVGGLHDFADRLLGLSLQAKDLHFSHMAARAVIVFGCAVFLARAGNRRMLGHSAGFEIMVAIIPGWGAGRGGASR